MRIEDYLSNEHGFNKEQRDVWMKLISDWRSWYIGNNKGFHEYSIYNGKSRIRLKRKSLQMAKKACEDWADILYNLSCSVQVDDARSNEDLNKVLGNNDFWLKVNQGIEKSFAVGTGAFVLTITGIKYNPDTDTAYVEEAEPSLEFVEAEKIYPLSWEDNKCTECAFVSYRTIQGKKYVILSVHILDSENYVIKNKIFETRNNTDDIYELDSEREAELLGAFAEFRTNSSLRWFCLISPAVANNVLLPDNLAYDYPFGISIFANAIDCIKSIDETFDSLSNEITIGRKRIFVAESMCETVDGQSVFDATDISVYRLPTGLKPESLLQPENSELRVEQIVSALNTDLSSFSNNVGMGKEMYKFDVTNMSTAAQVYSTNSELKRKRDKHLTKLENELYDILNALCYASSAFSHYNINSEGLAIKFDNSLFENIDTTSQRKLRESDAGVISRAEYRMEVFKEDEETAKKKISDIDGESIERMQEVQRLQEE